MSAIDEFSIKRDYTSATLHVQGLMLAGRKLEGALSAFCSPDIEVHSTVSQMAGDFIAKVTVKVAEKLRAS